MGVWIEMFLARSFFKCLEVTPLVGVWIEILYVVRYDVGSLSSLPLWECGLKYSDYCFEFPFEGHSPCGSVD